MGCPPRSCRPTAGGPQGSARPSAVTSPDYGEGSGPGPRLGEECRPTRTQRARAWLLPSMRGYQRSWVRIDVLAGLAAGTVVIPQAMAYSTIAGLPVEIGLYTCMLPMLAYALLGGSRTLSVSTTSTIAVLVAATLADLSPRQCGRPAERCVHPHLPGRPQPPRHARVPPGVPRREHQPRDPDRDQDRCRPHGGRQPAAEPAGRAGRPGRRRLLQQGRRRRLADPRCERGDRRRLGRQHRPAPRAPAAGARRCPVHSSSWLSGSRSSRSPTSRSAGSRSSTRCPPASRRRCCPCSVTCSTCCPAPWRSRSWPSSRRCSSPGPTGSGRSPRSTPTRSSWRPVSPRSPAG